MDHVSGDGQVTRVHRLLARVRSVPLAPVVAFAVAGTIVVVALASRAPGLDVAVGLAGAESFVLYLVVGQRSRALRHLDRLVRTSHRFERGFDDAAIGMLMLSPEMRVLRVNDSVCELLGRDAKLIVGRSILEFTHPEDVERSVDWTAAMFHDDDQHVPLMKRYVRPDGSVIEVAVVSVLVQSDDAEPYFFSQLQDVTEQRHAARQKSAIGELARRALESSDVIAMLQDAMPLVQERLRAVNCIANRRVTGGEIRNIAVAGDVPAVRIPAGHSSQTSYTLETSEPVISNDLAGETRFSVPVAVFEHGMARAISIRVAERSGSEHAILAHRRARDPPFTSDDARFLEAVAYVIAGALDRAATEQELRRRALEDPLTGLANRALLANQLDAELRHARRTGNRVCLLTLDLDRFKAVNDTLGHSAGDILLRQVATRLLGCVREEDLVARDSGDGFKLLCTRAATDHAVGSIAQRALDALVEPFEIDGREMFVTASLGIAISEHGSDTADAVLRDADAAMHRAKELGGGRYEAFDPTLRHRLVRRMAIEADLRHALERDQFELHYQPIVELARRRTVGFEALLRWHHPERGLIAPGEFIQIAEETGLIVPIGSWVLRTVAGQLSRWPEAIYVTANVSASQLGSALIDELESLLERERLRPGRLVLEITESLVLEPTIRPVLAELRTLGLQLALDDFGTGYSSLGSLQRFPMDVLKLDRTLVSSLPAKRSTAVARAAVELGRALGVTLIAEGIEHPDQLDSLRELGCPLGQGFLFAKPAPVHQIQTLIGACPEHDPARERAA